MLSVIFSLIILVFFAFFPLLLWGYGINFLSSHEWNRTRFFSGMIGGGISVLLLYLQKEFFSDSFLWRSLALLFTLLIVLAGVWIATRSGSKYVKVFLRKIALLHTVIFIILYLVSEAWSSYFEGVVLSSWLPIIAVIIGFLFAAILEESVKHLSSVGLTAREFRFSRRDLLVFSFFISLGFVFLENILYLISSFWAGVAPLIYTGISRSFFSLLAHVFSSSICVMLWWKALSYGVFSWRYIALFFSWFLLASISHIVFNTLVTETGYIWIIWYSIVAYIAFTQWLALDDA